jgi:cytochrome c2
MRATLATLARSRAVRLPATKGREGCGTSVQCLVIASLMLVSAAFAGSTSARADSSVGEAVFNSRCLNCHSLTPGLSTIAPDLRGVVGRKVGSFKNY